MKFSCIACFLSGVACTVISSFAWDAFAARQYETLAFLLGSLASILGFLVYRDLMAWLDFRSMVSQSRKRTRIFNS